jgi:hypothetical protein
MSSVSADGVAPPVPPELGYLIALNAKYSVLICISSSCQHALKPSTIARHLRDRHKALSDVQKQVDAYITEFPFEYDHTSVPLPYNGSSLQPNSRFRAYAVIGFFLLAMWPVHPPTRLPRVRHNRVNPNPPLTRPDASRAG